MRLSRAILLAVIVLFQLSVSSFAQKGKPKQSEALVMKNRWVDSVYSSLSEEERIGQLFMVAAYSGGKNYNEELITQLINAHQVGGLIFMQGGPARQANLTNQYQHLAQVPLLIGMDAEWGLGMRLDSVKNFPRAMMLGATRDTALVYKVGAAIAAQCKRLGVNMDFGPDVDVNNNALNPVINSRSFGEDKTWVARLGVAYMRGLQNNGVMACAKHFPGHGDTNADSHTELPLINKTRYQLDTLEFFPFRKMIYGGVASIMIAHLEVPALEPTPHLPSTLSRGVVDTLRRTLGYTGLIITDALNMQGVTKYFPEGEAEVRAFAAGNDILLFPQNVPLALTRIKNALDSGAIPMTQLELSVKRILSAKYDAGLPKRKDIPTRNIVNDLNQSVDQIRTQVAKAAVTVVKDENQILKKMTETMSIGYVGINASGSTPLYQTLDDEFNNVRAQWLPKGSPIDSAQKVLESLTRYDAVIVAVHNLNFGSSNNYGLSNEAVAFLQYAGCRNNVMVVLMGNAYAAQFFCGAGSEMIAYEDDTISEHAVADILLKKAKPKGKMPVTACLNGKSVCPLPTKLPELINVPVYDLKSVYPTSAGIIDQKSLDKLDMFMARCIAGGVFPGCRVLASKNGKVFYDKAFGYTKYDKEQKVDTGMLYDMASCTKVLATTLCVMRLYEQGKLDLDKTLGDYLPQAKGTNKAGLKIRDILLHQAGLRGWIPFYKDVEDNNGTPYTRLFRSKPGDGFDVAVARGVYLRNDFIDTMWAKIYASPLDNAGKFVYSDLDFYFLYAIVQQITKKPMDKYVEDEFYKPLGLKHILYNPTQKFDSMRIAPTELEQGGFRSQLIRGYVHDPGAALLGGVGGHAGIFASAHDVAVIFQMLLNKGTYGGKRYFKASTIDLFTAYHSKISHRGLAFDKPATDADDGGPAGDRCSALAFGHQGFTGTCVWADPANGILFVFLSNRVYPSGNNTKINKLNVRTTAQDYIYEAFGIPVNHERMTTYKADLGIVK